MLTPKYLLMTGGLGMILAAMVILGCELHAEASYRKSLAPPGAALPPVLKWRWRTALALGLLAWGPVLLALSILVAAIKGAG